MCHILNDQGQGVIAAFITPSEQMRRIIQFELKSLLVYVKAPLHVCVERDPKGLYKKAMNGEIRNFTGITHKFEEPENPDVTVDTSEMTVEECILCIIKALNQKNLTFASSEDGVRSTTDIKP